MQLACSPSRSLEFADEDRIMEFPARLSEDFGAKLKVVGEEGDEERISFEDSLPEQKESADEFEYFETHEEETDQEEVEDDGEDEDHEGEEDFSFGCLNSNGSPITADEAFQDGQIRPVFPLFDRNLLFSDRGVVGNGGVSGSDDRVPHLQPPLKKLFVENRDGISGEDDSSDPQGPCCSWTGKTVQDASPETCKKSNSTGFAKLRRFRDLVLRSNSDGKDAFVFLNCNHHHNNNGNSVKNHAASKQSLKKKTAGEGKGLETASAAHERLYGRNRGTREGDRRRSYLPYKQVGFFTDVHGLSRNIHPY